MNENQKPPEGQIKPGDVLSQFVVLRTKDNRIRVGASLSFFCCTPMVQQ